MQRGRVDMRVVVVVTVVTPGVLQESGGPLDKSLVRRMRRSHPADARVHTRSPARPHSLPSEADLSGSSQQTSTERLSTKP